MTLPQPLLLSFYSCPPEGSGLIRPLSPGDDQSLYYMRHPPPAIHCHLSASPCPLTPSTPFSPVQLPERPGQGAGCHKGWATLLERPVKSGSALGSPHGGFLTRWLCTCPILLFLPVFQKFFHMCCKRSSRRSNSGGTQNRRTLNL